MGIVQHQVFDMDEFASHPKGGRCVEEVTTLTKSVFDHMAVCTFVQSRQGVFRRNQEWKQRWMIWIGDLVSHFKLRMLPKKRNVTR